MTILTEVALPGEGNDRAFRSELGNVYRVRLVMSDRSVAKPVSNVNPGKIAPTRMTLSLSLALLDDDLRVAMAGDRYRIFDVHEITINAMGFEQSSVKLDELIEHQIAERMAALDQSLSQQSEALGYLSDRWGISAQ